MKEGLHPVYPPSRVTCACGHIVETRSTRGSFQVEICSNCHPFFTGKQKLMDTEGRVERFRRKYAATNAANAANAAKVASAAEASEAKPASLAEVAAKPEAKAAAPKAPKKTKEPKEAKEPKDVAKA